MIKHIDSLVNPTIKAIIKLHTAKGRAEHGQFIAEGWRTCQTLIAGDLPLVQIYATEQTLAQAQQLSMEKVTLVTPAVMNKISASVSPSGILAVFAIPEQASSAQLPAGLVLANIADPGNMGTLLRTAAAMNVKNVIIIDGVDVWNPKVVQSSAGCIGQLSILHLSWQELVALKKRPILAALVVSGGANPKNLSLDERLLIVGNEAHGIPPEWLAHCDEQITLAMPGGTESLNAAIAGSIALYLLFNK